MKNVHRSRTATDRSLQQRYLCSEIRRKYTQTWSDTRRVFWYLGRAFTVKRKINYVLISTKIIYTSDRVCLKKVLKITFVPPERNKTIEIDQFSAKNGKYCRPLILYPISCLDWQFRNRLVYRKSLKTNSSFVIALCKIRLKIFVPGWHQYNLQLCLMNFKKAKDLKIEKYHEKREKKRKKTQTRFTKIWLIQRNFSPLRQSYQNWFTRTKLVFNYSRYYVSIYCNKCPCFFY